MGLLTFSEMQSQVRSMLGGRSDQDALIMRGLQFAQHKIARKFEPEELLTVDTTTVTNTGTGNELTDATITMPSTLRKLHSLSIVDTSKVTKLIRVGADKWEELIGDVTVQGTGQPSHYVLYNKTVILHRVPDQTYTIRRFYSNWPTEIVLNTAGTSPSTTTATSDLDHKDEIIVTYATVWCYLALGNREKANYFFSVFQEMVGDAESFDILEPDLRISSSSQDRSIPDHTVPTFGGGY
jgi:hypothetical protein